MKAFLSGFLIGSTMVILTWPNLLLGAILGVVLSVGIILLIMEIAR